MTAPHILITAVLATVGLAGHSPAEHIGATDTTPVLPPVRRGRYIPKHSSERQADWKPAHTRAAARRRAQLAHVRPAGQRPDLRIEKTQPLGIERIREIVAGGTR